MPALRSVHGRSDAVRPRLLGMPVSADHFVLPRWLRRPVRLISRLGTGDFTPPRFAASMATVVLFGATALYGAYVGGSLPAAVQAVTARTGFAVDQVRVVGHRETSEIDVLDKLGLDGWTSLIGFDAVHARTAISELPWVREASVRKVYPDTLEIRIEERQPFAVWQHGAELTIISENGDPIAPFRGGRHASLPLVVGPDAPKGAADFIALVRDFPEIAARVKGYLEVADRRWDLRLDNGVTIKLPEDGAQAALADVVRMDKENSLLGRDIVSVDLRIADRVVVQLTPAAAEARQAALAAQGKKKPGKKA